MHLAQIRYFVALCEERNFTRAAKRCGVSQPSLSNGIKALERELGGELFERSGMSLTALGRAVRPALEAALASCEQIKKRATAFHRRETSRRRITATPNSLQYVMKESEAVTRNSAKTGVTSCEGPA